MQSRFFRLQYEVVDKRRVRFLSAPSVPATDNDGPLRLPLLLVHGLGCSSAVWERTFAALEASQVTTPIMAPDMPGYGRSPGPPEAMGMEELADWLARFLDVRRLERVHFAGNSMGCQVGLALARRHPHRVGAMVLQGPTTGTRLVPAWRYSLGLVADASHESFSYNKCLMAMYTQMGPRRYLQTVRRMLEDDPFASVEQVKAPCLVIRGGHDAIVSDRVARHLTAALPDAVYTPLDSAAHAIEFNNPREFTDSLLAFLRHSEEKFGLRPASEEPGQGPKKTTRPKSQTTATIVSTTIPTK